ncbi:MAG TPA: hypothetical protein VGL38_05925 [bacterium]|jgi:hypothetical protein
MKTKDYGINCLLASNHCEMVGHEIDPRGQVWIEWRDTELANKLVRDFYSGSATVNVADFMSSLKHIKTLIFNLRRQAYGDREYELHRREFTM